jgi:hypothetical protein
MAVSRTHKLLIRKHLQRCLGIQILPSRPSFARHHWALLWVWPPERSATENMTRLPIGSDAAGLKPAVGKPVARGYSSTTSSPASSKAQNAWRRSTRSPAATPTDWGLSRSCVQPGPSGTAGSARRPRGSGRSEAGGPGERHPHRRLVLADRRRRRRGFDHERL